MIRVIELMSAFNALDMPRVEVKQVTVVGERINLFINNKVITMRMVNGVWKWNEHDIWQESAATPLAKEVLTGV